MLKNIKAVLFDLDGTLVDSMWIWKSVDEEYFEKKGLVLFSQNTLDRKSTRLNSSHII